MFNWQHANTVAARGYWVLWQFADATCPRNSAYFVTQYCVLSVTNHVGLVCDFLQGVSMACYAEPCISYDRVIRLSVRLSVCLSVRVCHTPALNETAQDHEIFTDDEPFRISGNSKGFIPSEGVKWEWGGKNSQFSANISETVPGRTKVTISD